MVQGDSYTYDEPPVHGGESMLKEIDKLTEREIKELIEKVMKEGSEEAKYFLKLTLFSNRCHPDIYYRETYSVLFGEVDVITTNEISDNCTKYEDIIIIPRTKIVVILQYDGYGEPSTVYVFSAQKGWLKTYL